MTAVVCLGFGRRNTAKGLQQALVVEPVDPFQLGHLNGFPCLPEASTVNQFGLVQTVNRVGQGMAMAVALTAHRRFDAGSVARSLYGMDPDCELWSA